MRKVPTLRVVVLGHTDAGGGAARATHRLHEAFRAHGIESLHLVFRRRSHDPDTLQLAIKSDTVGLDLQQTCRAVQEFLYTRCRSGLSDTYMSFPYPGVDLSGHPALQSAHVVHLNWPGPQVSPRTVAQIANLGVPLVWTLHDESAYTGGCHYTAGCRGFERVCSRCPQLTGVARGVPALVLEDKIRLWRSCPLHLVTPSRWLARRAAASRLFRDRPVHHIPNPLLPGPFVPLPMELCRQRLMLPRRAALVLCIAQDLSEARKGFELLAEAMGRLSASGQLEAEPILVTIGRHPASHPPVRTLHLGRMDDDFALAAVYSAVDVVAVPSLEDNFPNVALEALGCGVPVVGFRRGGLPELVDDRSRGLLAEEVTAQALADCLAEVLMTDLCFEERRRVSGIIHHQFSAEIAAEAYGALFRKVARKRRGLSSLLRRKRSPLCPQLNQLGPTTADMARILVASMIDQRLE